LVNKELQELAHSAIARLNEAGIKFVTMLQLCSFMEITEYQARKLYDLFSRTWKVGDQPGSLAVPPVKLPKPTSLSTPSLSALRKATLRRVGEILDDHDSSDQLLAAAIRFMQSEPADQSEYDAFLRAARERWFKKHAEIGRGLGIEDGIMLRFTEELRRATQNPNK